MVEEKYYCDASGSRNSYYLISANFQHNNETIEIRFTFTNYRPVINNIINAHTKGKLEKAYCLISKLFGTKCSNENSNENKELMSHLITRSLTNIVDEALSFFPALVSKKFNISSYGSNDHTSFIKGSINIVTPQDSYSFLNGGNLPLFSILCDLSRYDNIDFFKSLEETFNSCMYKCIENPANNEVSQTNGEL